MTVTRRIDATSIVISVAALIVFVAMVFGAGLLLGMSL